jgi:hypothetical protein
MLVGATVVGIGLCDFLFSRNKTVALVLIGCATVIAGALLEVRP